MPSPLLPYPEVLFNHSFFTKHQTFHTICSVIHHSVQTKPLNSKTSSWMLPTNLIHVFFVMLIRYPIWRKLFLFILVSLSTTLVFETLSSHLRPSSPHPTVAHPSVNVYPILEKFPFKLLQPFDNPVYRNTLLNHLSCLVEAFECMTSSQRSGAVFWLGVYLKSWKPHCNLAFCIKYITLVRQRRPNQTYRFRLFLSI